jgi:hypothetical protein
MPAWKVAATWWRCKERDVVLPTVYQGFVDLLSLFLQETKTKEWKDTYTDTHNHVFTCATMLGWLSVFLFFLFLQVLQCHHTQYRV